MVLVTKNLGHGDRILIFLDDQFRQKIDHRHGQQDAQHLEILHIRAHREIQLVTHLRDVALGDRRSDHIAVNIRNLRIGEKSGKCVIIQIKHFAILIDWHKYRD